MDQELETTLLDLARDLTQRCELEEAQQLFYSEADARYSLKACGGREPYRKRIIEIFWEAVNVKHCENAPPLVEQIAENMAIYAGAVDDAPFWSEAERLLRAFETALGRRPLNYLEFEKWAHMQTDPTCRQFFVARD